MSINFANLRVSANRQLPCASYGYFKMFKISTSELGTVGMHRQFCIWAYEFLTTVTEDVVYGVHEVVIRPSYSIIW